MLSAARQPLGGWRNELCSIPITVPGVDLDGLNFRAQIRLAPDTPGQALLTLNGTDDAAATGIRKIAKTFDAGGVVTSHLFFQVSATDMQALPYSGEVGDAWWGSYALQINRITRLYGPFAALASPIDSDNAPANRPAALALGQGFGAPVDGVTLSIGGDGVTAQLTGIDLISPLVAQALAARDQIAAQADVIARAAHADLSVATYADRGAIPASVLFYGMHVYVHDGGNGRTFIWTQNVDGKGGDGWVGQETIAELNNRIDSATADLTAAIAGTSAGAQQGDQIIQTEVDGLATLRVIDLQAMALTTGANPPVDLSWHLRGTAPAGQALEWAGWQIAVDAGARSLALPVDWTAKVPVLVIGDSMSDFLRAYGSWASGLAAALGTTASPCALYSGGSKQVYRCGAKPIYLTLAGNSLPAGGGGVAVTAINGAAPGKDNPASFLFTYDGDNAANPNHVLTGTLAGRHVTVSVPSGGSAAYSVVADAGSTAVAVPPGSLFVPDFALQMATSELWIWLSQNYFYSGNASDHINPVIWDDLDAIVRRARGQRILIFGLLPDASWVPGTPQYTALRAYNADLKARYPQYYVVDAQGRDSLARILASGDGSAGDNADVANGVTPRSLRLNAGANVDTLHLGTGNAVIKQLATEWRAIQPLPPAVAADTVFSLSASGQDYLGDATSDLMVARTRMGNLAKLLAANS